MSHPDQCKEERSLDRGNRRKRSLARGRMPQTPRWKLVALSELLSRTVTYGIVQPGNHIPGGMPVIRSQDYSSGWCTKDDVMCVSPEIEAPYTRSRVSKGDLLITVVGANIGKIATVPEWLDGANISRSVARISVSEDEISSRFLRSFLEGGIRKLLHLNSTGGAQPVLNLDDLRSFLIPVPPIYEQQKIADILGTWDEALEKLDALIAAKDRRKHALMQQLLTGKRRLKGAKGAWRWERLDSLCEPIERTAPAGIERVLSITAGLGFQDQREKFSRVIAGRNIENYIHLKRGEFAYNKGNSDRYPQGCVYRLEEYDEGAVPNVWISFAIRKSAISSEFLKHFFLAGGHNHQLSRLINYGVRNDGLLNLTADAFFSIKIPVPPPDEQTHIGELCENLAAELRLLRQQRATLDQQKRGLMQQLLTGRIRVST